MTVSIYKWMYRQELYEGGGDNASHLDDNLAA